MQIKSRLIVAACATLLWGAAAAQPSEYYLWQHKTSGKKLCEPASPGNDWVQIAGPFMNSRCTAPYPEAE